MRADIRMVTMDPWKSYEIVVEITDGDESQIYRREWSYADGEGRYGVDDEGDPRRAMGQALEELGCSLQNGHGHPLVDPRNL